MKEQIKRKLIEELDYSTACASKTVEDLSRIQYSDLKNGVLSWLQSNKQTLITVGEYSSAFLMEQYHMTYPAALIFLDWYRTDPDIAVSVLKSRM